MEAYPASAVVDECERISRLPDGATHYDVLGIDPSGVTDELVKKRYRILALQCHPDKHRTTEIYTKLFQRINEANKTLSNQTTRTEYDDRSKRHNYAAAASGSGAPGSVSTSVRETKDMDLTPAALDRRERESFGSSNTENEGDRIRKLQLWLSALETSITENSPPSYDEVVEIFKLLKAHNIQSETGVLHQKYIDIINAVINKWLENKATLDDNKKRWILSQINWVFVRLSRIIDEHKEIFRDDAIYNLFKEILKGVEFKDLLRNIGYFRKTSGGSLRKSTLKRNQRNKRRTHRKKSYRKYKKSMKSK